MGASIAHPPEEVKGAHWQGLRLLTALSLLAVTLLAAIPADAETPYRNRVGGEFRAWLDGPVRQAATQAGVSTSTFNAATGDLTLDWDLPDLHPPGVERKPASIKWQAEFGSPSRYFNEKRLNDLAIHGERRLGRYAQTLAAVENRYGVPAEIIVAIWGRESSFGNVKLPEVALRAIATQAFMGRRQKMYGPELIALLQIIQQGDASISAMRSSWAGAMGQPQFLPTIYHRYAVDFDGDGKRDIWNSIPDSLASIGNFLRQEGWQPERGWGLEIRLPGNIPCTLAGPEQGRPMADWANSGVTAVDGSPLPVRAGRDGFLFLPAGRGGPAFIVTENFYTLKRYNFSDNYALFIGHLSDRVKRNRQFSGDWASTSGVTRGDIHKLQEHLLSLGYDVGGADGLVGFKTRIAIGLWQQASGLTPTCFPSRELIARVPG